MDSQNQASQIPISPGSTLPQEPPVKKHNLVRWGIFGLAAVVLLGSGVYVLSQRQSSNLPTNAVPTQVSQSTPTIAAISPTPTCRPRPACLDATPRCLIPETSDMCPPSPKPSSSQVACTQELKQCPDGSYVSRHPPKCEFSACP